jgi:hypothetical protein
MFGRVFMVGYEAQAAAHAVQSGGVLYTWVCGAGEDAFYRGRALVNRIGYVVMARDYGERVDAKDAVQAQEGVL